MRSDGRLSQSVNVINFFEYYAALSLLVDESEVSFVDIFVRGKIPTVQRKSRYIGVTGMRLNEFVNSEGRIFAQEILDETGGSVSFQMSTPWQELQIFKTRDDAYAFWLEELCSFSASSVLIADSSRVSHVVANVSSNRARKILTLHGNHFAPPYALGSVVKPTPASIIANLKVCDALVVLTQAQAADIVTQFGSLGPIEVIPNSFSRSQDSPENIRDQKLFVVVSRLETIKNLGMVIRAFRRAVDVDYSLKLEIWGDGSEEKTLSDLIYSLGLSSSVSLKGYTMNAGEVFSRARGSLASSLSEGFGLSLLESMSCGTPVIALAANYGPLAIIEDGCSGYLVKTEEEFAAKILLLAKSEDTFESLSMWSRIRASRYSPELVSDMWSCLINRVLTGGEETESFAASGLLRNSYSTASGNLFFNLDIDEPDVLRRFRRIEIVRIDRRRFFKGAISTIEPGIYGISNFKYEEEHSRFCLCILQGRRQYTGVIPKDAITFRLLP